MRYFFILQICILLSLNGSLALAKFLACFLVRANNEPADRWAVSIFFFLLLNAITRTKAKACMPAKKQCLHSRNNSLAIWHILSFTWESCCRARGAISPFKVNLWTAKQKLSVEAKHADLVWPPPFVRKVVCSGLDSKQSGNRFGTGARC